MAGFGLCDRLVRGGIAETYDITLIGDEPQPAYDRVNLSKFFDGRSEEDLLLAPREWYEENQIELRTGARVTKIDRTNRIVVDNHDRACAYDRLILATGSHAFVPPVPGSDSPGVFVYRTIDDLRDIKKFCDERNARVGGVIGGGLLGLEAAKVLADLGLGVHVLEMAPGLMPRQLDSESAALLKRRIEDLDEVEIHLVRRTESIEPHDGQLCIHFANADDLTVDLLIIAAGVRPNDQLARESELEVGERGGIVVNERLQTSDPQIFAIGECASFRNHVFGLVAPCFKMADVLAERLGGGQEEFEGADESAELKLMGVQVATLGRAIGDSPGGVVISHSDDSAHRRLLIESGRIVGASCVGDWEELPQIRHSVQHESRLWPWQRRRFVRTGSPWTPGGVVSVTDWPDDAIVCSCLSVTKGQIDALIADGQDTVEQVATCCGASTACGSCQGLVTELVGDSPAAVTVPGRKTMLVASIVAVAMGLVWWITPPLEFADSVQSSWRSIDVLWRSDLARQISGFSLLSITLIGLLFSFRKRFEWLKWGSYGFWRAVHGVLGSLVLFGIVVHTGFSLGSNLNWWLGVSFISAAMLGGIAGIASSLESRFSGSLGAWLRRWRPRLTTIHLWVTWPLPVLIALHILSFYWFSD